jgi:hypothetical protein
MEMNMKTDLEPKQEHEMTAKIIVSHANIIIRLLNEKI